MPAIKASLKIEGLKELDAMLAGLPDAVDELIMETALREAGPIIVRAAQDNIRSRSGATASDIRMDIQVERREAVAAIGGTFRGRSGRAHVLRWLELGTRDSSKRIVAGESDRKEGRRAARALRRIGDVGAAKALRAGIETGRIGVRRALKLPGGIFRRSVRHRGIRPQSPLTRALAEEGDHALSVLAKTIWREIVRQTQRMRSAA